jgi:hypothetical protein
MINFNMLSLFLAFFFAVLSSRCDEKSICIINGFLGT